jgi:hypothetical protein
LVTFLDHANISFFSPRGLFAMVITSTPDELSPILTINVFESSNASTTDLNMQGLTFGEIDQGHTSSTFTASNQPQSRRPNKLQKMSTFISEYGDRRANSQQVSLFSFKSLVTSNQSISAHQSIKQHPSLLPNLHHIQQPRKQERLPQTP